MLQLNDIIKHVYLTDIYRLFYPKPKDYTFFSEAHGTLSKLTTYLDTEQVSTGTRNVKQHPACYLTTESLQAHGHGITH